MGGNSTLTYVMLAVIVVIVIFMFRNSRKRKSQMDDLQRQVVPGARVMTNSGVFGTILSIDDEANEVKLETHPGTVLTVHRQTVGRVIEPVGEDGAVVAPVTATTDAGRIDPDTSTTDPGTPGSDASEPEYGERAGRRSSSD